MRKLRFLHIPKTGGSTLISILNREYDGKGIFSFSDGYKAYSKRYQSLSDSEKRDLVLFVGHAPIITGISDADTATIFTLLRDPVVRVKSFCQHVAEGKSPYLAKQYSSGRFNLDSFPASGNNELSNLQTKILINKGRLASPLEIANMSQSGACDRALDNLYSKVAVFGLQEYFDESLIIFMRELNWKMPFYAALNRSNPDMLVEFKQHHIDQISDLNSIDIDVYRDAKEKFLAGLYGKDEYRVRVAEFKKENAFTSI